MEQKSVTGVISVALAIFGSHNVGSLTDRKLKGYRLITILEKSIFSVNRSRTVVPTTKILGI